MKPSILLLGLGLGLPAATAATDTTSPSSTPAPEFSAEKFKPPPSNKEPWIERAKHLIEGIIPPMRHIWDIHLELPEWINPVVQQIFDVIVGPQNGPQENVDISRAISGENACASLRGLTWLIYGTGRDDEPLEKMGPLPELGIMAADQKGPVVRLLRSMMIWTRMLQIFRYQLENTRYLHEAEQLNIAKCYTDYALEVSAWLAWMKPSAPKFPPECEAVCAINDNLRFLYREYQLVAMRLYGHQDDEAALELTLPYRDWAYLLDGRFPIHLPDYWDTGLPAPKSGVSIGDWVRDNDASYSKTGRFAQAITAFTCNNTEWESLVLSPETKEVNTKQEPGRVDIGYE